MCRNISTFWSVRKCNVMQHNANIIQKVAYFKHSSDHILGKKWVHSLTFKSEQDEQYVRNGTFLYFPGCNILKWKRAECSDWVKSCLNLASTLLIWSSSDIPLYSMFVRRPRPHHSSVYVCGRSKACAVQTSKTDGIQSF